LTAPISSGAAPADPARTRNAKTVTQCKRIVVNTFNKPKGKTQQRGKMFLLVATTIGTLVELALGEHR
jgi:hypothetical protein